MKTIILKVASFLFAAAGFTSYILGLVNMNSMDGELYSDIGNACMITACFVSLWALHAIRGAPAAA